MGYAAATMKPGELFLCIICLKLAPLILAGLIVCWAGMALWWCCKKAYEGLLWCCGGAAPRVPTAEEKLAADQARFNEWCKSRGL